MKQLPETHQKILAAIYVDDLSYVEASKFLGISIGTIGPTRGRALEKLFAVCGNELALVA